MKKCVCVLKCVSTSVFTHQPCQQIGQGVIVHLVPGPLGGSHTYTHKYTSTHHEGFCWSCPWSGSGETPFRSIPSPRTPCWFCAPSPSQQPLTPPCQGLFPKIRLNMNIHKQNGTPRLWKLSKTYLHLILKEPPSHPLQRASYPLSVPRKDPTKPPLKKPSNLPSPSPKKTLPSCPSDHPIHSTTVGPDKTRPILLGIIWLSDE